MNSAASLQRSPDEPATPAAPHRAKPRWILMMVLILAPLLAGLAWHRASDDPLWFVFRGSLNLCNLQPTELSPLSPDGRYRVHIVQATCAARFPETMVFVSNADEAFPLDGLDPNRAVLEVAGHRTVDAVVWEPVSETKGSRMSLRLWMLKGSTPSQLHRVEDHWRDVPILLDQSKPAPGAEKLDY